MNDVLRIARLKIALQMAFLGRAILIFTMREDLETVFLKQKRTSLSHQQLMTEDDKYRQLMTADDNQRKLMTAKKIDDRRWQIKPTDDNR